MPESSRTTCARVDFCRLRNLPFFPALPARVNAGALAMDGIIYLVGLVVVIMALLSFFGIR
jgi:hypothetical protein